MKTLLTLFLASTLYAQQVDIGNPTVVDGERVLLVKGRPGDHMDMRVWLVVEAHNAGQFPKDGYNPSLTRVVCDYMPLFRKLPTGQYEIIFSSEVAKDIP